MIVLLPLLVGAASLILEFGVPGAVALALLTLILLAGLPRR